MDSDAKNKNYSGANNSSNNNNSRYKSGPSSSDSSHYLESFLARTLWLNKGGGRVKEDQSPFSSNRSITGNDKGGAAATIRPAMTPDMISSIPLHVFGRYSENSDTLWVSDRRAKKVPSAQSHLGLETNGDSMSPNKNASTTIDIPKKNNEYAIDAASNRRSNRNAKAQGSLSSSLSNDGSLVQNASNRHRSSSIFGSEGSDLPIVPVAAAENELLLADLAGSNLEVSAVRIPSENLKTGVEFGRSGIGKNVDAKSRTNVTIHIGRVEVKAELIKTGSLQNRDKGSSSQVTSVSHLSLKDYLKKRSQGKY